MNFSDLFSKYQYADIRIHNGLESGIRINDDDIKSSSGKFYGASARVLENGSWGFASSNHCDASKLIEKAAKLAALEKGNIELKETKIEKKTITKKAEQISLETKR